MRKFIFFGLLICLIILTDSNALEHPRYFHMPNHEIMQSSVYIQTNQFDEIVVAYADKGCELKVGDYITHTDGVRTLNGGLSNFLKSGEKEAVVPVVDENDSKHGGYKLLGFVMIQPVMPRKISSRRGEIAFDFEEGGIAPNLKLGNIIMGPGGVKTTSDPSYQPPPHGGGPCITSRDCYYNNGTCLSGQCKCNGPYTGTFCQLDRPDVAAVSKLIKRAQDLQNKEKVNSPHPQISVGSTGGNEEDIYKFQHEMLTESLSSETIESKKSGDLAPVRTEEVHAELIKSNDNQDSDKEKNTAPDGSSIKKGRKKKKPHPKSKVDQELSKQSETIAEETANQVGEPAPPQLTVEDLYGDGKEYPEPYTAGKLPGNILRERYQQRTKREVFRYSVRFRTGPLGLIFDNKISNSTIVEKVVKGQQADLSDIKAGDRLLAIEQFNVSTFSPKISQRILNDLPWPKVLVFEVRYTGDDPEIAQSKIVSRSFNITVLFPPTLVGEYTMRSSEWTPPIDLSRPISTKLQEIVNMQFTESTFCPIYRLKAVDDSFGCEVKENDYALPDYYQQILDQNGFAGEDLTNKAAFFSILLQEAFSRRIHIEPRSAAIMKRGVCTFVEKAKKLSVGNAQLGFVVNTDNEIIEMPTGKEKTAECTAPVGMMKLSDGQFLQLAARTNEIWAVLSNNGNTDNNPCENVIQLAEDIVDKWPHTVPSLTLSQVMKNKPPDQSMVRGLTEEGGRMALSGENGWAFFDYHLAMFGPQEVPLGPFRFIMAMPPFGCDPSTYSVRITDAVVAILRGGGCSFGIKVINAQKLGAKAVVIVNTDDMKTMRLMALPDEVPLIKIPCIMVSRRIQHYLEEQLRPYYPVDQHLVSIQPTGIFGDYEKKNLLVLPQRLGK